ncbi:hypothetical protein BV20DRAFT_1054683 [Pilatotrama ljubarskyi]|nr:hypothetical protein BV20DRAFT_1054683 [Pilatotrama ljubarskyi]
MLCMQMHGLRSESFVKAAFNSFPTSLWKYSSSYLEPQDLLHLSRTCKKFRAFFLDRKLNEHLWRQARQNLATDALPPRPPFMSEPAFIHLLYSPYCHNCGTPNVRKILPACLMRCCSKCLLERTVWYHDAIEAAHKINVSWASYSPTKISSPTVLFSRRNRPSQPKGNRLLKEHVDHIFNEIKTLPTPLTREAIKELMARLREEYNKCLQYARLIHGWLKLSFGCERGGWDKDLEFMGAKGIEKISEIPVVRQSLKLTEGAWRKVLAALETYLNETHKARLEKEYRAAIRARFDALDQAIAACYVTLPLTARMDCRPQPIDFALTPVCRAIMDVPTSETVTAADFASVLPSLAANWHADRKDELTRFIRPILGGEVPAGVDPLELAIACFLPVGLYGRCCPAIACMRYPAILAHKCRSNCFHSEIITKEDFDAEDQYTRTIKSLNWTEGDFKHLHEMYHQGTAYVPFHISTAPEWLPEWVQPVVAMMSRIVSALGLDTTVTTFDQLEACNTWLRCEACETRELEQPHETSRKLYAYSWRGAFTHDASHYKSPYCYNHQPEAEWRRADEGDYVKVHAAVEEASRKGLEWGLRSASLQWSCSLCPVFVGNKSEISHHLAQR